ncbi:hypothetical protein PQO03_13935 [Lentisphaera profundi]|uniref:Twin-arginine translocation signal domain-containing protein n=1 Tax=Lentisphaera profundi TaxID=1658616 RepID=A0ABY7W0H1_9BACT|nr:hypothetical protein [Lentisphaera profundi]WDE98935.1 hypothetical protein PQO03_13935 [Lentisphaera profundi]
MPITLPPITRRQFVKHSLALGGTEIMAPEAFRHGTLPVIVVALCPIGEKAIFYQLNCFS